jgi:hypothetical protein
MKVLSFAMFIADFFLVKCFGGFLTLFSIVQIYLEVKLHKKLPPLYNILLPCCKNKYIDVTILLPIHRQMINDQYD